MLIKAKLTATILIAILCSAVNADTQESTSVLPAKISMADAAGMIFQRADMSAITHEDGHQTEDVTTMMSSDGKFGSGMYRSGKVRFEIDEPYGVDEFMFVLKGSITLTSSDGSVMTVQAGEGVTLAKEWTGIWETEGYEKIWVIYSEDGAGL